MLFIVVATGLSGFLFSFGLLRLGCEVMWIRYVAALSLAYLVFLTLIRLWALWNERTLGMRLDRGSVELVDLADAVDGLVDLSDIGAASPGPDGPIPFTQTTSTMGDWLGIDLDLDEIYVVLALMAALVSVLAASLYVILSAPSLFAEVLLDSLLSAGLYRRLRHLEGRSWLRAAIGRTILPALAVTVFFYVAGIIMQSYAPEATSIGGVWQHFTKREHPALSSASRSSVASVFRDAPDRKQSR